MSKRRFKIEITGEAVIELDNTAVHACCSLEDIARDFGYKLVVDRLPSNLVDGLFYKGPVRVVGEPNWEVSAVADDIKA